MRLRGLTVDVGPELEAALPQALGTIGQLRERLIAFVVDESSKVRQGERVPGTTEVLESCFGKLKALEDGQSKSGFTGVVLSLGAIVSNWTSENVHKATRSPVRSKPCNGLVRTELRDINTISAAIGVRRTPRRNTTEINEFLSQDQFRAGSGRGSAEPRRRLRRADPSRNPHLNVPP